MLKYIIKRVLISIIILIGVSVIIYALIRVMPSDYIDNKFQAQLDHGEVSQADVDRIKDIYGIGDKTFKGIVGGYGKWLGNIFKLDFGKSFIDGQNVTTAIFESMWVSFTIALVALVFQFVISIPLGIKSASNQYGKLDYTATVVAMMGTAVPSYFFAALLMKIFSLDLNIFPLQGLVSAEINFEGNPAGLFFNKVHHLILPLIVFVILSVGSLMRFTRTNMLEVLNSDYIRTARAKGIPESKVIYKHAFRNTLIPLVTTMAGVLPSLFSGAMIIESVFAIPGIGQRALKATMNADVPFIMGYSMFIATLTILGTLLSDLAYGLVDPRVKLVKNG